MAQVMHKTAQDAAAAYRSQCASVVETTRPWMGLLFHVGPDGLLHMERTTSEFPLGRVSEVIDLIKRDMVAEMGLDHSPLPMAAGFGIVAEDYDNSPQPASIAEVVGEV